MSSDRPVERAEIKVRLAPELRRAARVKAEQSGLSLNSWAVHVIAAAVGPEFFRGPGENGAPRTIAESRDKRAADEQTIRYARSAFVDRILAQGIKGPELVTAFQFSDEEALDYWDTEIVPNLPAARRAG